MTGMSSAPTLVPSVAVMEESAEGEQLPLVVKGPGSSVQIWDPQTVLLKAPRANFA